jgi:hypothetical protein
MILIIKKNWFNGFIWLNFEKFIFDYIRSLMTTIFCDCIFYDD